MIDGEQEGGDQLSVNDFNGDTLSGLEADTDNFWRNLLFFMRNEDGEIGHTPILESDFPSNFQSVYKYIADNCDLNGGLILQKLKQEFLTHGIDITTDSGLEDDSKKYFWNESLSRALAIFLGYFDPDFDSENVSGPISADDIRDADAGNSFNGAPWVKPEKNIDNEKYQEVRGADRIKSVLNNEDQLQFTRRKSSKWIRLLMPKYLRKVEVEDLNRNFWVISSVLGAVCNFLFDDTAPFKDLFKSIISELVQLWENILYIWATLAVVTQKKKITNVHVEVVPISNDIWQSYIKFDNFKDLGSNYESKQGLIGIASYVRYIIDQYTESNVCIVPVVRDMNYKHNYYAIEHYPGFIFFDRNKNKLSYLPLLQIDGAKQVEVNARKGATTIYKNITGALYEKELKYSYIFPISVLDNDYDDPYYLLLRTIPEIDVTYDEEKGLVINSFVINVHDVSKKIYGIGTRPEIVEVFNKETDEESQDYEEWSSQQAESHSEDQLYTGHVNHSIISESDIDASEFMIEPIDIDITEGYYQGEFPSYCYPLLAPSYNINIEQVYLCPFMASRPDLKTLRSGSRANVPTLINTSIDNIIAGGIDIPTNIIEEANVGIRALDLQAGYDAYDNDSNILNNYAKGIDHSTEDTREFKIYVGNHPTDLWGYVENPDDWRTWTYCVLTSEGQEAEYQTIHSYKDRILRHASSINFACVLYNPITQLSTIYDQYFSQSYIPTGWVSPTSDGLYHSVSKNYTFVYLNDSVKVMNETNWLVRYVEVRYGLNPREYVQRYISKQKDGNYDLIVSSVRIHIFGPGDGITPFYACKVYDRYEEIPANQALETMNLDNWKISYVNKQDYLNFNAHKNSYILLSDNRYDFELYPNTGLQAYETMPHNFIEG